jgi:hypothetical protein
MCNPECVKFARQALQLRVALRNVTMKRLQCLLVGSFDFRYLADIASTAAFFSAITLKVVEYRGPQLLLLRLLF